MWIGSVGALVPRSGRCGRPGIALLEALVALVIVTVAGLAATAAVRQGAESVRRAEAADAELREASAFLDAVALWPREDLDRHLGDRPEGVWRLHLNRPIPTLYLVSLADSTDTRTLLQTALYRPVPAGAP
jgi:type II secretory pathway pseudopilin PulG